jgi:type IV pilus assembly protein PilA
MFSLLKRKSVKGFTLIELMVVVAIISVLSSVAIPNFMKFQARAKQTEARINLKAAYIAAKAKYAQIGQYSTYYLFSAPAGGVLSAYRPENNNVYSYIGNSRNTTNDFYPCSTAKCNGLATTTKAGTTTSSCATPSAVASTATTFVFKAIANIDVDPYIDLWSVDSSNNIVNSSIATAGTVPNIEGCNDVIY